MNKKCIDIVVAGILLLIGVNSHATIITNVAGIEDYEWLEFSYTVGLSRDEVENTLLRPGQLLDGYRYATRTETAALLNSYYLGGDITDIDIGWTKDAATAADMFLNDFGSTYALHYTPAATYEIEGKPRKIDYYEMAIFWYGQAYEISTPDDFTLFGHVASLSRGNAVKAGWFYETQGSDSELQSPAEWLRATDFAYGSSLLVRETAPVPEPATILLFSAGMAGLAGSRFRRKKSNKIVTKN